MNFKVEKYTEKHLGEVQILFKEVFGYNQDLDKINIEKKLSTLSAGSKNLAILIRDEHGVLAGVLGIYPVLMQCGEQQIKAGQIGDAMVRAAYRGLGLFSKLILEIIELAKTEQIELIYTLPSILNVGSYKGFVKTGFVEKDHVFTYSIQTPSAFLSRILRKISPKLYLSYCKLQTKPLDNYLPPLQNNTATITIPRTKEYINYKKFNSNQFYQLKTGVVWLNIGKFEIKVGDYSLKPTSSFSAFVEELKKLSTALAKDNLTWMHNQNFENNLYGFDKSIFVKTDNIRLMVFYINESLKDLNFAINFVDSDTF